MLENKKEKQIQCVCLKKYLTIGMRPWTTHM